MKKKEKLDKIAHVMRRVYTPDHPEFVEAMGYLDELREPWWRRVWAKTKERQ